MASDKIRYDEAKTIKPIQYKIRTIDDLDKTKIDWIIVGGWHSGMKVEGVYPKGTTGKDILNKLRCSHERCMARLRMSNGKFYCSWFTD